jgi:hypothetical protein
MIKTYDCQNSKMEILLRQTWSIILGLLLARIVRATHASSCVETTLLHPNATGSQTISDFAKPFNAGNETSLTLSAAVYASETSNGAEELVSQAFWLTTTPPSNLSSENLLYQGCSLLWLSLLLNDESAEGDPGDCSSVISAGCIAAIVQVVNETSAALAGGSVSSEACLAGVQSVPDACVEYQFAGLWQGEWVVSSKWSHPLLHNANMPRCD